MKILVAGGAGFIGSHLCEELLKQGEEVFCVDNLLTGNLRNIRRFLEDKQSLLLRNKRFHFIKHDIIKPLAQRLTKINFEAIFHLASPASPNPLSPLSYLHYPIETLLANSLGTLNLLNLAQKNKAKFLFASTSEIYGDPKVSPQPETYWGNVNPNGIRSCYDEAKRFGEAVSAAYLKKFDVDVRIIRIFNTFGPRMDKNDGRVVVNFINQAIAGKPITVYGKGLQTRSFCYVDDLIRGLLLSMFQEKTKGMVINLGNAEEHSILEFAQLIIKLTESDSKIVFKPLPEDDPSNRCPDISKAKKLLNWKPKVSLKEGLLKTIDYFEHSEKQGSPPKAGVLIFKKK
ncbi:NAD-dependent dehydratase [Candidatus Shapirobacteria bacterium CG10_big_fil_rev_8_21_14_0_10_38_14]|uniref:UDP-glucuronate decarboxylase n=1 Tax=Candidatus Shapirobacteria bacterium CG10_big_fil_rev_8_21_14_0_10_38_14 TaxID=1974483 RepID=A0A2M8L5Q0_9BACT|nr:MAG: NAD-dependent dehydratase [Candidatus Shapirobacteria bacterium CG10_big_fil_rev_8_21_14_0_10_38_14]